MKNKLILSNLFLMTFLFAFQAFAIGEHCMVKPNELSQVAKKIFRVNKEEGQYFPNESTIQMNVESDVVFENGELKSQTTSTIEGFYRPDDSNLFSLLPIPLFVAQLERERHIVYLCAHNEDDPKKSYVIIYFLRGYRISPPGFGTFIGDFLFSSVKVEPIMLVPFGTIPFKNFFENSLGNTPFRLLSVPVDIIAQIQNAVVTVLSFFTGIGAERITITDTEINISSGVNLNQPDRVRFSKTISLTKDKKNP